ncbi:MAG: glycoside hydrolase family 127 protein [Niastella sp.]|nr:glycoside hydrolase family 127 protein [Niastella sp.]
MLSVSLCAHGIDRADSVPVPYLQNRAPLVQKPYLDLPFGAIQPRGWLGETLQRMKNGMCGKLDSLYPAVLGKRNGWLGGDGDVWERGPYWLDGLAPLAYILNDKALQQKLQPWIEWSLKNQMADGYFGPIPPEKEPAPEPGLQRDRARDWWPKMVMLKVLQQYYTATKDKRVIDLMLKYARYQLKTLPATPLGHYSWWGAQRGGDNLLVVHWLYNVTGEKFLLELADIIHRQSNDWTNIFLHSNKVSTTFQFHCVNLAQGIKEPVIYYQQQPQQQYIDAVKKAFSDIRTYQGLAHGLYGGDELTRGNDPNLGSELCSAVEMMYSLENMMTITGDVAMMDHLEKIAYNALPTQVTDDYMARQYYQQANQVMVTRTQRNFVTNYDGTDQCYGVLTGFPCCTTNMHQGWPKFVQNLWHATADNGVAALQYAPSEVTLLVAGDKEVKFVEETEYPFGNQIKFTYQSKQSVHFPFHLRIPGWCTEANIYVNGQLWQRVKGNQVVPVVRKWTNKDVLTLELPMQLTASRLYNQSAVIERGPLVYALKIGENWKNVSNTDKYGDYREVRPTTPWNYGITDVAMKRMDSLFHFKVLKPVGNNPWNLENAPVSLTTRGKRIPEWQLYNEAAGPVPYSGIRYLKNNPDEEITLIPYGCTTLRISQFPVVQ